MTAPVAIVTCAGTDVDPDSPILLAALANEGVDAQLVVWDDPAVQWDQYELNIVRSTWDYPDRVDEFLTWAADTPRLVNPYDAIFFSIDKHYLASLENSGVRVVPSTFVDVGTSPVFPGGDFVVKPCVGAGSIDAERYGPSDHEEAFAHVATLHGAGRDALIQPYVASVDEIGETALIFIDGQFSHAMRKSAMLNVGSLDRNKLFRMESMAVADADEETIAFAKSVIEASGFDQLLYARVDLVSTPAGWAVMELELVEPSLFFYVVGEPATTLARAIARRLDSRQSR